MNDRAANSMLAAIFAFRQWRCDISLTDISVFLQVCDSEGVTFKELAYLCAVSEPSVSRAIQTLRLPSGNGDTVAHGGIVRVFQHPDDGRRRMVFLTSDGRALRDEVGRLLHGRVELREAIGL